MDVPGEADFQRDDEEYHEEYDAEVWLVVEGVDGLLCRANPEEEVVSTHCDSGGLIMVGREEWGRALAEPACKREEMVGCAPKGFS